MTMTRELMIVGIDREATALGMGVLSNNSSFATDAILDSSLVYFMP